MSDTFASLNLEEFGITFAAAPASQAALLLLSGPPNTGACASGEESAAALRDFENHQGPDSFYCVIS
jgi:hypothetical protein